MAILTINKIPCLTATIRKPLRGCWWGTCEVDAALQQLRVGDRITLAGTSTELYGTVSAVMPYATRVMYDFFGGNGGLIKTIKPKHYQAVSVLKVVKEILTDAGETLSSDSQWPGQLPRWTRVEGTASAALDALEVGWRVQDNGTVRVAPETWPSAGSITVLDYDRDLGACTILADDIDLAPGVSVTGAPVGTHVTQVVYDLSDEAKKLVGRAWVS